MDPDRLRASDADRERSAEVLRMALAEGRFTPEELEERLDRVYRATTLGELAEITRDLPQPLGATTPSGLRAGSLSSAEAQQLAAQSQGKDNISATFGGVKRAGRWLVEPHTTVSVLFGGVDLDLREAVLAQRDVVFQCAVIFGGLRIMVPPGVRVISQANVFLGGVDLSKVDGVSDPSAPTIRITGTCLLGGIQVLEQNPDQKSS